MSIGLFIINGPIGVVVVVIIAKFAVVDAVAAVPTNGILQGVSQHCVLKDGHRALLARRVTPNFYLLGYLKDTVFQDNP